MIFAENRISLLANAALPGPDQALVSLYPGAYLS